MTLAFGPARDTEPVDRERPDRGTDHPSVSGFALRLLLGAQFRRARDITDLLTLYGVTDERERKDTGT